MMKKVIVVLLLIAAMVYPVGAMAPQIPPGEICKEFGGCIIQANVELCLADGVDIGQCIASAIQEITPPNP